MFKFSDNKDITFNAILPNLRYKNNKLYFNFNKIIKIKIKNKTEYKGQFELPNIGSTSKLNYMNYQIHCSIIKEELPNGLKVNVKLKYNNDLSKFEMQKIARYIESSILNINIEDESEDNSDQYNDRSKYCNRGNECNEDNYDNDRSIIYEDDVKDDSYYDYDEKFHI